MHKILLVEDDHTINQMIQIYLSKKGYDVTQAYHGEEALHYLDQTVFDLVITDIMMPKINGYGLAKIIRESHQDIPILMLSALDQYLDKEEGFDSGTDDYMVKPIDLNEMLLRIKALLKRYQIKSSKIINLKTTYLDYDALSCIINNQVVDLKPKEFLLLFKLLQSPNHVFTRDELMNDIWGYDTDSFDRTVDTHIKLIRKKTKTSDFEILTVRGIGYKAVLSHA